MVASVGGKSIDLGPVLNSVVDAIGDGVGGQILTALIPVLGGAANNIDIGALIGQVAGGAGAGAMLTAIVGLLKNRLAA